MFLVVIITSSFYSFMFVIPSFVFLVLFFFFKQKTAYEMRISDWSSDVCSSDLRTLRKCAEIMGAMHGCGVGLDGRSFPPLREKLPRLAYSRNSSLFRNKPSPNFHEPSE